MEANDDTHRYIAALFVAPMLFLAACGNGEPETVAFAAAAEASTTTIEQLEETTTTDALTTTTSTATSANDAGEGLVQVVQSTTGDSYLVHASTADPYPEGEEFYWAVGITDFVVENARPELDQEQYDCAVREFLLSPMGLLLTADDAAGLQENWVDSEGWPIIVEFAVDDWLTTQLSCEL